MLGHDMLASQQPSTTSNREEIDTPIHCLDRPCESGMRRAMMLMTATRVSDADPPE